MTYLKTMIVLFALVLVSCNSAQKTTSDAMDNSKNSEMTKKMLANGFKMGTIVASKVEGDCPYVIQLDDDGTPYYLDPVNLEESFKKDGEKIWFTFSGLRMMNRCEKANPVSIIKMEKREE